MSDSTINTDLSARIREIQIAERRAPKCAKNDHDLDYTTTPVTCKKCGYDRPTIDDMEAAVTT